MNIITYEVKLSLSDREFICPLCGSWFDRDVALALVILNEGLCLWNAGETPRDENASTMAEYLSRVFQVSLLMNWEATPFGGSSQTGLMFLFFQKHPLV